MHVYQCGLTDIYFILWVIIQYYCLFCCPNCSSFGHWVPFQIDSCTFSMFPHPFAFLIIEFTYNKVYLISIINSFCQYTDIQLTFIYLKWDSYRQRIVGPCFFIQCYISAFDWSIYTSTFNIVSVSLCLSLPYFYSFSICLICSLLLLPFSPSLFRINYVFHCILSTNT